MTASAVNSAPDQARSLVGLARLQAAWSNPTLRKSLASVFDQALVSGVSFTTSVILGRNASQEELGVYFLALTIILVMRGVQAELITAPFTIFRQRMSSGRRVAYAQTTLTLQLLVTVASVVGFAIAAAAFQWSGRGEELATTFWVLVVVGPFLLFREFLRQYSFASLRVGAVTSIDAVVGCVQVAGIVALVAFADLTSPRVYLVVGIANVTACVIWWLASRERLSWNWVRLRIDAKRNWTFARWALASQIVCSCTPYILPWFLAQAHGAAAAGVCAACTTLIGLSYMFTTAIANLLTPKAARAFAQEGISGLRRALGKTLLVYVTAIGAFATLVFFTGDWMLVTVYGVKYAGYGAVCFLLSLGVLLNSFSIAAGNGLWAMNRPQSNLYADAVTLVVTLAAAFALVGTWGVWGAAIASTAGIGVGAAVRLVTLRIQMNRVAHELH